MTYAIGPDVSFYQDDNDTPRGINFATMRVESDFVIIRAGQRSWPDPDFPTNWKAAKAAQLPRGSYWFYDSREAPSKQAWIWANQVAGDFGELPFFCDFEESYGGAYAGWLNWYHFLEAVKAAFPGKEIGIYTAYWYWKTYGPKAGDKLPDGRDALEYFHQFPLWIANYGATKPAVPTPWGPEEWIFFQYTDKGPGPAYGAESNHIDLNWAHGDAAWLKQRFNLPEPEPVPQPDEIHFVPHPGLTMHRVFRFGSWCHVAVVQPELWRMDPTVPGLKTCSEVARETGAQLVVNGGAYSGSGRPTDAYMRLGTIIRGWLAGEYEPYWHCDREGVQEIRYWNAPGPKWNGIAGKRIIVDDNRVATRTSAAWYEVHPRTLVGVRLDGVLVLCVIDGRQPGYSEGVNLFDGAAVMIEYLCDRAIDWDGGGSSTMVLDGHAFNRPIEAGSPGTERAVGTHLALWAMNAATESTENSERKIPAGVVRAERLFLETVEGQVELVAP